MPRSRPPAKPPITWALRSTRIVTPFGIEAGTILVTEHGMIDGIAPHDRDPSVRVEDVGDLVVLPGLVDTHVHLNDPGRADWEGFATGTAAAAAGGITTIVDMPLNSAPVTTTPEGLAAKREAAAGRLRVDCGFFGGIVPGNADQVEALAHGRVLGFKAFLCHSGIDDFPDVGEAELRAVMPLLARWNLPLLAHAEVVPPGSPPMDPADPRSYAAWLASRPPSWEVEAIRLLINLCREYRCHVHIVHLATAEALPLVAEAKAEGLPLTVETCPHYLTFAAEEIPDGDPRFKCAPPIRSRADREALWEGLRSGLIDTIGTDHSPAPPSLKHLDTGDLSRAWGGIASLQLSLPAVWTEARKRGFDLIDLARWMAASPARLVGLEEKGGIGFGKDADLVVFDPDAPFAVDGSALHHRHPATPYDGRNLVGRVVATYLRGIQIARGGMPEGESIGRPIDGGAGIPAGPPDGEGQAGMPAPPEEGSASGVRGGLERLDSASPDDARAELLRCCGSTRWADAMAGRRPFASEADLIAAADAVWDQLDHADRLEAFAAHPRIGDLDSLRARFASTADWASGEQSGVSGSDEATLAALAEGNREYESRFGHIFIVCATGKTAAEILALLRARLGNSPGAEAPIVAEEQAKITRIRLRKLCP